MTERILLTKITNWADDNFNYNDDSKQDDLDEDDNKENELLPDDSEHEDLEESEETSD